MGNMGRDGGRKRDVGITVYRYKTHKNKEDILKSTIFLILRQWWDIVKIVMLNDLDAAIFTLCFLCPFINLFNTVDRISPLYAMVFLK